MHQQIATYFDCQMKREFSNYNIGDLEVSLTPSQFQILQRMLGQVEAYRNQGIVFPFFIESETGTGKTQLSIAASAVLFKQISASLNRVHAVYISPTTFLASQASERFSVELQKLIPDLKMVSIKGTDADKPEKITEVFSIYAQSAKVMLSTNPQFLSSLATKHAKFYNIPKRSSEFELIKAIADANVLIVDEIHFYQGKSVVRLLTLLLSILQFKRMSIATPTIILFLSASMDSSTIDSSFYYLNETLGLDVNLSGAGIDSRILRIEEKERGERWVQFLNIDTIDELHSFLLGKVGGNDVPTVLFWDSIPRLVQLQEFLDTQDIKAAIYHAQMPKEVQQENLGLIAFGEANLLLTTSISEIGIEFESLNFQVAQMLSINTRQVSKLLQRLGRLARRKGTSGVFYAIDVCEPIDPVSKKFANNLTYEQGRKDYPSFLEKAQEFSQSFFTGYFSPKADLEFSRALNEAISTTSGEVFPIYLSNVVRVNRLSSNIIDETPETKEHLYLPYWRLSAGAFRITNEQYLEFSKAEKDFFFQVRNGFVQTKAFLVTSLNPGNDSWKTQRRSKLRDSTIQSFWSKWRMLNARLGEGEIVQTIPGTDTRVTRSQMIRLEFEGGVFPKDYTFLESDFYEAFTELISPLDCDLEFYWKERDRINDRLYCFEPESGTARHHISLGAIEKLWMILTGEGNAA